MNKPEYIFQGHKVLAKHGKKGEHQRLVTNNAEIEAYREELKKELNKKTILFTLHEI